MTVIEIKNKGIHILEQQFNKKFEYYCDHKIDRKEDKIYYKECGRIEIYTDYENLDDVVKLANHIMLTDIVDIFDKIAIHSKIKGVLTNQNNLFFITLYSNLKEIETIAYIFSKNSRDKNINININNQFSKIFNDFLSKF